MININIFLNSIIRFLILLFLTYSFLWADGHGSLNWEKIENNAKNKTVYFYAWGGLETINNYIMWVGEQVKKKYNIELKHIKTTDTALTVKQILAEDKSGASTSSVDLVWINGENFKTLKDAGLLLKDLNSIPNVRHIDFEGNPTASIDFSEPVNGQGVPWGTARLTFFYHSNLVKRPPRDHRDLLTVLKQYPGRFTYPAPPEFHGSTFLKQLLVETIGKKHLNLLSKPVPKSKSQFNTITAPLWEYLSELHPLLWRKGRNFPTSLGNLNQLFSDREVFLSLTFNPNFVANQVHIGEFPATTKNYSHKKGGIGNTHFLAVPKKTGVSAAAQVVINYFISAKAQSRKADIKYWGDPTVLALNKLSVTERNYFTKIPGGIKAIQELQSAPTILEPHSSWTGALEAEWLKRYGK